MQQSDGELRWLGYVVVRPGRFTIITDDARRSVPLLSEEIVLRSRLSILGEKRAIVVSTAAV